MASNLIAMASNLLAMASTEERWPPTTLLKIDRLRAFKGGLADILEMFFQRAKNSAPDRLKNNAGVKSKSFQKTQSI